MDLELRRGDTPTRPYKFFNELLEPMDLSGVTIWLTVKPEIPDPDDPTDETAILKHYITIDAEGAVTGSLGFTLGGIDPDPLSPTYGQLVSGVASGVVTHKIPFAESNVLAPGTYLYDIQLYVSASDYYETLVNDATFTVLADVTRRGVTP